MNILIIGINYSPELVGIGKYTGEMAEWLSGKGAEVRVVTAPPYYPEWEIGHGHSASKYKHENMNGIQVWRCPVWIPKRKNGINRITHLLSFAMSSFPVMLKQIYWQPDIIISIEPTFFCAPLSIIVSKLTRAKSWLHIQDFEIDASFKMGFLSVDNFYRWIEIIEKKVMNQFDCISTISKKMLEKLAEKGIPPEKCVSFPNWVDTDTIYPLSECEFFRKEWGIREETTVILYSGNMGQKQGLEVIIEVAKLLSDDENIFFVLCGTGAVHNKLVMMAKGMENLRFLPLQPLERFNKLLNTADIHLLPQRDKAEDLVMPSKLTGILSCGGIVIATGNEGTELANVVRQSGGMVCPPGDSLTMAKMIKKLSSNPLLQTKIRIKARKFAETYFQKEVILNRFFKKLHWLIRGKGANLDL